MTTQPEKVRSVTGTDIAAILLTSCGMDPDAAAAAPEASLEELGLDSLAVLELQAVVAERYRVRIPDPDEAAQLSIGAIAELVDRQREEH
jgi:aromatase